MLNTADNLTVKNNIMTQFNTQLTPIKLPILFKFISVYCRHNFIQKIH